MSWRAFIGAVLIIIGAGFFLDQLDILDFGGILATWWPLILVLIGALQLLTRSVPVPVGIFILLLGGLLQLNTLDLVGFNVWSVFWPAIIVFAGFYLILTRSGGRSPRIHADDRLDSFVIFGGSEQRVETDSFQGGSAVAVFGGSEIDLRECRLDPAGATLDLTAAFGGIEVSVPLEWKVKMTGLPLFGGWDNKTQRRDQMAEGGPELRVRCVAAFGGVEVHN